MADSKDAEKAHAALQLQVKSKILERIHANLVAGGGNVAETTFVKANGTNYGMYTKNDDNGALVNIWEKVFPAGVAHTATPGVTIGPAAKATTKKGG